MNKTTLPLGIRQLKNKAEKGTFRFDLPIQRASGQWTVLQKSLLIHSMLADFPVPPLYFIKYKDEENETIYQALDGKQRCTSIFDFIDGDFALHASTPPVSMEGCTFDLANMKFEDLSEECRDSVLGFRFTIYALEDATDEEIEEAFFRLNAATPLTTIQKARTVMGTELAGWIKGITNMPFFTQALSLTLAQARRESELEVALQSMLLMDAKEEGYNYKAISMAEVMKYCQYIRNTFTEKQKGIIQCLTEYLSEAFPEKHKFLKKSNVPMVFVISDLAMSQGVSPQEYREFIHDFAEDIPFEYQENMGSGNIKRAKTEGRLMAMFESMKQYFDIEDDAVCLPIYEGEDAEAEDAGNMEVGKIDGNVHSQEDLATENINMAQSREKAEDGIMAEAQGTEADKIETANAGE